MRPRCEPFTVLAVALCLNAGVGLASLVRNRNGVYLAETAGGLHGALSRIQATPPNMLDKISVQKDVYIGADSFSPGVRLVDKRVEITGAQDTGKGSLYFESRTTWDLLQLGSGAVLTLGNITIGHFHSEWETIEEVLIGWLDMGVSAEVVYDRVEVQVPGTVWFAVRQDWQERLGENAASDEFIIRDLDENVENSGRLVVKEALISQVPSGKEGIFSLPNEITGVTSAWEFVSELRKAEKEGPGPIRIFVDNDIVVTQDALRQTGGSFTGRVGGPVIIRRDVVVENLGDKPHVIEIDSSLAEGKFAEVLPGVQLIYKNVQEVIGESAHDVCSQQDRSPVEYGGRSGFVCGLSYVHAVLQASCPYVKTLRYDVETAKGRLRKQMAEHLPPPLVFLEKDGTDSKVLVFNKFVGCGVCYTNVTVSCADTNPKKKDKNDKALIILVATAAALFLVCLAGIFWVPKACMKYFVRHERKRRQSGLDSNSISLGGLGSKGNSVKTYLMGQINGERLGISDDAVEITEQIASGGYGVVYKGTWKSLPVAIKTVIFQDVADGAGKEKQRAIFEAAISSSIAHRNVVQTYTYSFKQLQTSNALNSVPIRGDDFSRVCVDWKLYIVQELCEGGSLRNSLKDRVLKSCNTHDKFVRGVLQLALDIAEGLLHLHKHNIIHGDVNTKNVLLREDNAGNPLSLVAKIADFGLSVKMNYMQSHISNHKAGTPFYMAPEVVQHGVLSKRADIFSYGVVLWEIYHQSCPIQTTGANGNLQYHEKFPKFPVSCPMLYALLCVVCLSPSPEDRPDFEFVIRVLKAIKSSIDNDKEFLPSKIQKQNLDLVKKLNGKTGRELVEFVGELLGEEPPAVGSGSVVISQDVVHDSAEMGGDGLGIAKDPESGHSKRKMKVVSSGTDPTYSMTITLGSKDGHSGYSSDSISFSWDRASSPEPKAIPWNAKQKALAAQKAKAQHMRNFQEVPVVGTNPLLVSGDGGTPLEDKSVLPEIPEASKPNLPESQQSQPTFPLRLSAPAAGQREMELMTSGSSQRSDSSPMGFRPNIRGVGLISAKGGIGRWSQENKVSGEAAQITNDAIDESGSVDFYSLNHPNSEYYSVSVDEIAKAAGANNPDHHYYGPS